MLYLPHVLEEQHMTRSAFNHCIDNGIFNYDIPPGKPGVARLIDLITAHDIGFVAMLMRHGYTGPEAKRQSGIWCEIIQSGKSPPKVFLRNPASGTLTGIPEKRLDRAFADVPSQGLAGIVVRPPLDVSLLNLAEVMRRNAAVEEATDARLAEMAKE